MSRMNEEEEGGRYLNVTFISLQMSPGNDKIAQKSTFNVTLGT